MTPDWARLLNIQPGDEGYGATLHRDWHDIVKLPSQLGSFTHY